MNGIIPRSRLVIVPGRKHYLHREVPAELAGLIGAFLAGDPADIQGGGLR